MLFRSIPVPQKPNAILMTIFTNF